MPKNKTYVHKVHKYLSLHSYVNKYLKLIVNSVSILILSFRKKSRNPFAYNEKIVYNDRLSENAKKYVCVQCTGRFHACAIMYIHTHTH